MPEAVSSSATGGLQHGSKGRSRPCRSRSCNRENHHRSSIHHPYNFLHHPYAAGRIPASIDFMIRRRDAHARPAQGARVGDARSASHPQKSSFPPRSTLLQRCSMKKSHQEATYVSAPPPTRPSAAAASRSGAAGGGADERTTRRIHHRNTVHAPPQQRSFGPRGRRCAPSCIQTAHGRTGGARLRQSRQTEGERRDTRASRRRICATPPSSWRVYTSVCVFGGAVGVRNVPGGRTGVGLWRLRRRQRRRCGRHTRLSTPIRASRHIINPLQTIIKHVKNI
jgi:hypothetical protein